MDDECPVCFDNIDNLQYAIINGEGENSKYHPHHLVEWFTTHKSGIMTQSPIKTYSIFKNGEHSQTINVELHYSELKVFANDIENDISNLWNGDASPSLYDEEESDDFLSICCFW